MQWTVPESGTRVEQPFAASIQRMPGGGGDLPDGTYHLSYLQDVPAPGLVIAQVSTGAGEFELLNAGRTEVTFAGEVAFYNLRSGSTTRGAQDFTGTGETGPIRLEPGERIRVGTVPWNNGVQFRTLNPSISRIALGGIAAVVVLEEGRVLDALVTSVVGAEGLVPSSPEEPPAWTGHGVVGRTERSFLYRRVGVAWTRTASDWEVVPEFPVPAPAALSLPLASFSRRLEVQPDQIALVQGAWSGTLRVDQAAAMGRLQLDDWAGGVSESPAFAIQAMPGLTWHWVGTNATQEGGAPLDAEIRLSEPAPGTVRIHVSADDAAGLELPTSLDVPAGATKVAFRVTPVDDGLVNGTRTLQLRAEADGFRPAPPVSAWLEDASGVRVTLETPSSVTVTGFGATSFAVEVRLDRPVAREIRLPFRVLQRSPEDSVPRLAQVQVPDAVLYPGRSNATVMATAQLGAYAFSSKFEIRSLMAGWSNGAVEIEVVPSVAVRVQPVGHAPLVEGAGLVTNGLYAVINALLPTNLTVHLSEASGGRLTLPASVVLPAMTSQVAIPVVVGDNDSPEGPVLVDVTTRGEGFAPESLPLRIEEDDYSLVGLDLGGSPWDPAVVDAGVTNEAQLILFAGLPSAPQYTAGDGTFRVEFDAGLQDVRYFGPSSLTVSGGRAPLSFRMDGAAYNVRLRLVDAEGRVFRTGPFEVRPNRTVPLEPALVVVTAPEAWQGIAGVPGTVEVVVRNAGPAAAERSALTVTVTAPFDIDGLTQMRFELGSLAVGQTRTVVIPLASSLAAFGECVATAGSDNPAPEPVEPPVRIDLRARTPEFASGRAFELAGLQDLAFSAARNRFYATSTNGNGPQLIELDPATASVTRQWSLPGAPGLVGATASGSQLYVALNAGTELLRMDLASGTTNLHFALPAPILDFVPSPGRESDVVVYRPDLGVQLFRDAAPVGGPLGDHGWLESDPAGNRVGAYAGNFYLYSTAGQSLVRTGLGGGPFGVVGPVSGYRILDGRAYGADGSVANTGAGFSSPYLFSVVDGVDVCPDAPANRIYFATQSSGAVGTELVAHDLTGRRKVGAESIPGVSGRVSRLTRWGRQGLAFATTGGQVFFVETSLVPDGEPLSLALGLDVLPRESTATNYVVRARVTNEVNTVARQVRVRLEYPVSDQVSGPVPTGRSPRVGVFEWDLGDLAAAEVREVTVQIAAATEGTRWLGGFVHGSGVESSTRNNAAGAVVHVERAFGRHLDIAPLSLAYDRNLQRYVMSVATVGGLARPGLLLLDRQIRPERWINLDVPAEKVSVTQDGSAVYALYAGSTELRRTRLADGETDVVLVAGPNRAFSQIHVNPLRSDEVAAAVMRTDQSPSFVEVVSYRMSEQRPAKVTRKSGFLVPGAVPGEFFGHDRDASPSPFQHLRFTTDGIEWLGELPGLPTADRVAADTAVDGLGWVHRNVQGGTNQALALGREVSGVTTIPGLEEVLTLETVPVPVFLKRWKQDLTPRGRRAVPERPVAANLAAAGPDGLVLIGLNGYEGVVPVRYDEAQGARLSMEWKAKSLSVAPGELLETVLQVTNHGPDPAVASRIHIALYPAELVEFVPEGPARIEGDELVVDSLAVGGTAGGVLRYRAPYGQLIRLLPTLVTWTFPLEAPVVSSDILFSEPTPAGRFQVSGAAFRDLAYDATRNHLWGALPGTPGVLAVFDPTLRRLLDVVNLDFEPARILVSQDGRYLYVAPGTGPVRRVELAGRTVDLLIPLTTETPENVGVFDMAVSPADSGVLAVSRFRGGSYAGIAVYYNGVLRGTPYLPNGEEDFLYRVSPGNVMFRNAGELVATFGTGLHRLAVTSSGVSAGTVFESAVWPGLPWFTLMGDRVLFHQGRVVRLDDGVEEISLPRSDFLQQNGWPAADMMVGDPGRNQAIAVLREPSPDGGRYLRAMGIPEGEYRWTITATAGGTPVRMLLAGPDTLVMNTGTDLWFLPLAPLANPSAPLTLSGSWSRALQPADAIGILNLAVGNPGPWDARNVVVQLPPDADQAFPSISVEPAWLNAVREPGRLRIPVLPALTSAGIRLQWTGRSQLGDYAPTFAVTAEGPDPVSTPPSVSPVVRVMPLPDVTVHPLTVIEGDSGNQQVRIPIRLSAPSLDPVVVALGHDPITAENPADFSFSPGATSVFFPAGSLEAVALVQVRGDLIPEVPETFRCRLVSARGARLGASASAVITIVDNDVPRVRAGQWDVSEGNEGTTWASVPVQWTSPLLTDSRIEYVAEPGTAAAGVDFAPIRGVLAVSTGQSEAVLRVPVVGDRVPEADETFRLVFVTGPDLRVEPPGIQIRIINDDVLAELRIGLPSGAGPGLSLPVATVEGVRYQLERADLLGDSWHPVGDPIRGTGGTILMEDPEPSEDQGFYRVVLAP